MTEALAWTDHRVFATQGSGAIVFGADEASLFAIDPAVLDVMERWRGRGAFVLDEVPKCDRQVIEALVDARVLAPARRPAGSPAPRLDPSAIPLATLVLEIAQACNLRCSYCYAGGGSYGGTARLMRPEVARRAARFLVASSGERGGVTLVLFGGEPLLNLEALEAAVFEAETAAREHGKKLAVSLTTNGTRLTPGIADFLCEHRVAVSISIDGPPDLNDANRRYPGRLARGSYADIVAGLQVLCDRKAPPPAARVTLTPSQWARVPEVFDHLIGLGFGEVGIAPASPVSAALLPTADQEEALFDGFSALAARFVDEASAGRVLPFANLLDLLGRLHVGQVKAAPCGAGLGYLAVDAEGGFFICHRLAGATRFKVGDLNAGVDHARIRACLDEQAALRRRACAVCWARSLCAGGCHYENHVRETDLGLPAGGCCAFIRRWLELGIKVYGALARDHDNPVLARLGQRAHG